MTLVDLAAAIGDFSQVDIRVVNIIGSNHDNHPSSFDIVINHLGMFCNVSTSEIGSLVAADILFLLETQAQPPTDPEILPPD
jgi:hypothetical protein